MAHGELSEAAPGPGARRGGRSAQGAGWSVAVSTPSSRGHESCGAGRPWARPLGPWAQGPATRHPLVSGQEAEQWKRAGQSTADFTVVETGEQVAVTGNGPTQEGLSTATRSAGGLPPLTMYGLNEQKGHELTSMFPVFKTLVTLGMVYDFLRCS